MQLPFVLVILASAYCASGLDCFKGNEEDVCITTCPKIKNVCSTTNAKDNTWYPNSRTCASKEECEKWKADAIKGNYPYTIFCCTGDLCNDQLVAGGYSGKKTPADTKRCKEYKTVGEYWDASLILTRFSLTPAWAPPSLNLPKKVFLEIDFTM